MIDSTVADWVCHSLSKPRWFGAAILGFLLTAGCGIREAKDRPSTPVASAPDPDASKRASESPVQALKPDPLKLRSGNDPVVARLISSHERTHVGDTIELVVAIKVDAGYEIYSLGASAPHFPTRLEMQLPPGLKPMGEWLSPAPVQSLNPGGGAVYVGEFHFVRKIQVTNEVVPGDHLLVCSLSYQACNSRQCLRPIHAQLSVQMSVSQ